MTDDRILSAEEVGLPYNRLRLLASHEALRARLTAAEERAEQAERERRLAWRERDQAIRERDEAPLFGPVESARVRITDLPCAETATRTVHDNGSAEAQVAALTEALRAMRQRFTLKGQPVMVSHSATESAQFVAEIDAALAAADQTDEGDE